MCWPQAHDPLKGCRRQRRLLKLYYGVDIIRRAECYAHALPGPLTRHVQLACFSIAMKYAEDEPMAAEDLFPGMHLDDLAHAEWYVLETLGFNLRQTNPIL
jgi:hypothetical protein